jgi:hypothetical protein
MNQRLAISLGLVRDIERLGLRWGDWRSGERRQSQAVETLCGTQDPRRAPEIVVGREEFNIAGEIMVCLFPDCGGFVRGRVQHHDHVYWSSTCRCPDCGQQYVIQDY